MEKSKQVNCKTADVFGARAVKVSQNFHFYCFHNVQEVKEMSNHLKKATNARLQFGLE